VATLAGVSTATVSHVINQTRPTTPDTRARVERAVAQLGFVPDAAGRALAMRRAAHGASARRRGPGLKRPVARAVVAASQRIDVLPRPEGSVAHTKPSEAAVPAGAARVMLRMVRAAQPVSRAEVARRLGVHRSTVTDVLKPLVSSGVLVERDAPAPAGGEPRALGRPPVALSFGDLGVLFVGVSLGVRHTQVGATTLAGDALGEEEFETPQGPAEALARVREAIERLRASAEGRSLAGVGLSVPGPTDAERTRMLHAPHLGWRDVDVAAALRFESAGGAAVPVVVENDATAAAVYEARLRLRETAGGSASDFVLVRSGTGIGVGLVLGGEVYRGTGDGEGLAGEFGHMTIIAGGKPCPCGNRGCWERYASASSASALYAGERVQLGGQPVPRFVEIVARAEAGELRARRTLERIGEYLGIGIGNVITGLGVPRVIVSGRLVYGWKFLSGPLREAVGLSMAGRLSGWSVEPGEPTGAGLGGALEVAADEFLSRLLSR
jgi:predicted NBD/HSP70 family sugar kinase